MRSIYYAAAMFACLLATGCWSQNQNADSRVSVSGAVTLDGSPLASGVLNLTAVVDGRASHGEIKNGTYQIDAANGPNQGEYLIQVYSFEPIAGAKMNESGDIPTRQIIPAKYNKESKLIVEFTSGDNVNDLQLTTQ